MTARRQAAAAQLTLLTSSGGMDGRQTTLTGRQIQELIVGVGGIFTALKTADAADKAKLYQELGLQLTYDDLTKEIKAEAKPTSSAGVLVVSEGDLTHSYMPGLREVFDLALLAAGNGEHR
ncbi:hypothetical protein I6A60_16535 [Frankia sp. AgB1.9]|uniref:hypothetical protein n=1 Tax=unclassified Frankia TaxID=2632575 RepID=UPI0019314479|nr:MULTISPECIES: hypothetical protein [unclassified Frankia]MBL7488035.1 hypothetical protein [Frankia sp. AgW1.1]MBL7549473.1 hypothetical protein [Frankia sp. AgB1.9]MBL7619911.1 hypothetical protein [Frankia sp. AgB1.8]